MLGQQQHQNIAPAVAAAAAYLRAQAQLSHVQQAQPDEDSGDDNAGSAADRE